MQSFATGPKSRTPNSGNVNRVLIDGNRCEQIDNQCLIVEGPFSSAGDGSGIGRSSDITFSNNYCDAHASQAVWMDDVRNATLKNKDVQRGGAEGLRADQQLRRCHRQRQQDRAADRERDQHGRYVGDRLPRTDAAGQPVNGIPARPAWPLGPAAGGRRRGRLKAMGSAKYQNAATRRCRTHRRGQRLRHRCDRGHLCARRLRQ